MNREQIIREINYMCKDSSNNGGFAERNFMLHQKTRNSFKVRRGNYIDWSDDRFITIYFTKDKPYKSISSSDGSFLSSLLAGFLDVAVHSVQKNKEIEEAQRVRIRWNDIESIS